MVRKRFGAGFLPKIPLCSRECTRRDLRRLLWSVSGKVARKEHFTGKCTIGYLGFIVLSKFYVQLHHPQTTATKYRRTTNLKNFVYPTGAGGASGYFSGNPDMFCWLEGRPEPSRFLPNLISRAFRLCTVTCDTVSMYGLRRAPRARNGIGHAVPRSFRRIFREKCCFR